MENKPDAHVYSTANTNSGVRQNIYDIEEQIRQLEINGKKLGIGTQSTHTQDHYISGTADNETGNEVIENTSNHHNEELLPFDKSLDHRSQKTIADLRTQLEYQKRETARLQAHMNANNSGIEYDSGSLTNSFYKTPRDVPHTRLRTTQGHNLLLSHEDSFLKKLQTENDDLRRQLIQTSELSEKRSKQFRETVAEVKTQLHEVIVGRDAVLQLKEQEKSQQESQIEQLKNTIEQLKNTIDELEVTNHQQKQHLSEAADERERFENVRNLANSAFARLRQLLADRCRESSVGENGIQNADSPLVLIHAVETWVGDMERNTQSNALHAEKLLQELEETRLKNTEAEVLLRDAHKKKLCEVMTDHEQQLQSAVERANNARLQTSNLQSQLTSLEKKYSDEMTVKDEAIRELEKKVDVLKAEFSALQTVSLNQREAVEKSLGEAKKEIAKLCDERNNAVRDHAVLLSKVSDYEIVVEKLQAEVEANKEERENQEERENTLRMAMQEAKDVAADREETIRRLQNEVIALQESSTKKLNDEIDELEKKHKEILNEEMSKMRTSLETITEKYGEAKESLELATTESSSLRAQAESAQAMMVSLHGDVDGLHRDKEKLEISNRDLAADVERLTKERDFYCKFVEQHNQELARLKAGKERVEILLDEKERNAQTLQQQTTQVSQILELNSRNTDETRVEKERLLQIVSEKSGELEKLQSSRETTVKKLKIREKRLRQLEDERREMKDELEGFNREMKNVRLNQSALENREKEVREKLVSVTAERDKYRSQLEIANKNQEKMSGKLKTKLEACESELRLSRRALKQKESVENKAMKLAEKVQKDLTAKRARVDQLQSTVRWLEERVDVLTTEKKRKDTESEKFRKMSDHLLKENKGLTEEINKFYERNSELREVVGDLEAALEKSAVNQVNSQKRVECMGQELARRQIHHQLQVKETQQTSVVTQRDRINLASLKISSHSPCRLHGDGRVSPTYNQTQSLTNNKVVFSNVQLESELHGLLLNMRSLMTSNDNKMAAAPLLSQKCQENDSFPNNKSSSINHFDGGINDPERLRILSAKQRIDGATTNNELQVLPRENCPKYSKNLQNELSIVTDGNMVDHESKSKRAVSNSCQGQVSGVAGAETALEPGARVQSDLTHASSLPGANNQSKEGRMAEDDGEYNFLSNSHLHEYPLMELHGSRHVHSPPVKLSSQTVEHERASKGSHVTHDLCTRLERKMEELSRMGGTLHKENIEMASLIASQDQGIRKVKELHKNMDISSK